MRARTPFLLVLGVVGVLGAVGACGGAGFERQSKVNSVRMFGVKADKPYAKPGETVTLTSLVTDARRDKPRPLRLFWIPVVCTNPREDLYYACFIPNADGGSPLGPPFADASAPAPPPGIDAGAGGGSLLDQIPRDVDLGGFLPQGETFSFQVAPNAIQPRTGSEPYGLSIVFNIACAGQVRFVGRIGSSPQQVPIQCTDEQGNPLGADDYVLGINRVYSYENRTNTNPVVERVTLEGAPVDPNVGLVVDRCVGNRRGDCKEWDIDVRVSDASWELNQDPATPNNREQIWATYYTDVGDLNDNARLLFDIATGRIDDSAIKFRAPYAPGTGTLWIVVHDNRAGAELIALPLQVR